MLREEAEEPEVDAGDRRAGRALVGRREERAVAAQHEDHVHVATEAGPRRAGRRAQGAGRLGVDEARDAAPGQLVEDSESERDRVRARVLHHHADGARGQAKHARCHGDILAGSAPATSASNPPIRHAPQPGDDLAGLGEAARAELRVDHDAVHRHVEDATGALDQLRLRAEGVLQLRRQTGGAGLVVSHHAVGDLDVHLDLQPHGV